MSLIDEIQTNDTRTTNGMPTNSTSGNAVLDLFFKMGAMRTFAPDTVASIFKAAFNENKTLALRALFHNRDILEGQGERRTFRIMFRWLCENYPADARDNIGNVVRFGRWDDVLVAFGTPIENDALAMIAAALRNGDALCAKWMPRENKRLHIYARRIMKYMGLYPKQYRRMLARATNVIETDMCNREWSNINYSHVPSQASNRYRKAFYRNDAERYAAWVEELTKPVEQRDPKVKVNAGAIYPHDIVSKVNYKVAGWGRNGPVSDTVTNSVQAQWDALPNFIAPGKKILPVCDVSGSMTARISNNSTVTALDVCIALGLYISERNLGIFKDAFITFSGNPTLQVIKSKKLVDRIDELSRADWAYNTNLEKVFTLILNAAVRDNLPAEDMPDTILIMSDMQFDQATQVDQSAIQMVKEKYGRAGYDVPNVVFWNLATSVGVPVKVNEHGVACVSGFSPSIMQQITTTDSFTPMSLMMDVLNRERYDSVVSL